MAPNVVVGILKKLLDHQQRARVFVCPFIRLEAHTGIKTEVDDTVSNYLEKDTQARKTLTKLNSRKKTSEADERKSKNENIKSFLRSPPPKKTAKLATTNGEDAKSLKTNSTKSCSKSSDLKKKSKLKNQSIKSTSRSNKLKKTPKVDINIHINVKKHKNVIRGLTKRKRTLKRVPKNQDGEIVKKAKVIFGRPLYYCHTCNDQILLTRTEMRQHFIKHGMPEAAKSWAHFRRARSKRSRSSIPSVYPCEICSEYLPNQEELDEHLKNHDDQFFCDICNAGFKLLIDHAYHMQEHSEDRLFQCPLCEFKSEKRFRMKLHLYDTHEQFRKFKCEVCGKGFSILSYLEEHKNFHTGEKPFQCDVCGLSFMYTRYLKSHKTQKHSQEPRKRFECTVCQKSFAWKKSYDTHVESHHTEDTNFMCDICGKSFKTKRGLSKHKKLHSDDRPYKCRYCDMSFKSSGSKVDHERIHTGVKPHQCPECGKGFIQRTPMVRHWRNHAEKESYSCYRCQEVFSSKLELINHVKVCGRLETLQ
ncbi:hypothetical protein ILUMI_10607 [Ignelater luminosus]|uniref:C2H2-type domain-containing protein n=1 Tax=Ignelater luminosus TaxID=2038154 RepID=A0A8K0GET1_IGNLU|nr:hypothetical protein ILUMI_10607 [Ignelater luminosus]